MSTSAASYDVTLLPSSPLFDYAPTRDGAVDVTWNASYTGMSVWPENREANPPVPIGRQYRRTQAAENVDVRLRFRGTGFALCYTSNDAQYNLNLDSAGNTGIKMARGDEVKAMCGEEPEEVAFVSDLRNEEHEVVLSVSASTDHEFQLWGGKFSLGVAGDDGLTAVRADTIDDQTEGWKFVDAPVFPWDGSYGGRTLYNTTHTFNCGYISNITMSRTFTGAGGVIVLGNVWRDSHAFSIALDGEPVQRMDASSAWEDGQTVFFAQGGLDVNTAHTITVLNYNEDRPSCPWEELVGEEQFRYCCTGVDALVLLHAVEPSETSLGGPPPTGNSSRGSSSSVPIGALAGGAIGGVVVVALLALLSWFLLRRHRRSKRPRPTSILASELSPGFTSTAPTAPWSASSPSAIGSQGPIFASPQGYNSTVEKPPAVFTSDVGSSVSTRPLPRPPGAAMGTSSSDKHVLQASESANPAARLTEADMQQVLQYVATRLDRDQPPAPMSPTLPQYPGPPPPTQRL